MAEYLATSSAAPPFEWYAWTSLYLLVSLTYAAVAVYSLKLAAREKRYDTTRFWLIWQAFRRGDIQSLRQGVAFPHRALGHSGPTDPASRSAAAASPSGDGRAPASASQRQADRPSAPRALLPKVLGAGPQTSTPPGRGVAPVVELFPLRSPGDENVSADRTPGRHSTTPSGPVKIRTLTVGSASDGDRRWGRAGWPEQRRRCV